MSIKKAQTEQTISNLKSEIEFRKKLAKQHVTGEILLPDAVSPLSSISSFIKFLIIVLLPIPGGPCKK